MRLLCSRGSCGREPTIWISRDLNVCLINHIAPPRLHHIGFCTEDFQKFTSFISMLLNGYGNKDRTLMFQHLPHAMPNSSAPRLEISTGPPYSTFVH